jgi:hypothetical protein
MVEDERNDYASTAIEMLDWRNADLQLWFDVVYPSSCSRNRYKTR